eukprot:XP_014029175.1 PREDICTED: transcription factor CP2-like protein 1 [Salmo salar]
MVACRPENVLNILLSVGVVKPRAHLLQLNTVKFLWDPVKNASVFIQVNCISTELTPRKHGGEKGVPFHIQIDTFTPNKHGEYLEHVHFSNMLTECSFWPDAPNLSSTNCTPFPAYHSSPTSCSFTDGNSSPIQQGELILSGCSSDTLCHRPHRRTRCSGFSVTGFRLSVGSSPLSQALTC